MKRSARSTSLKTKKFVIALCPGETASRGVAGPASESYVYEIIDGPIG